VREGLGYLISFGTERQKCSDQGLISVRDIPPTTKLKRGEIVKVIVKQLREEKGRIKISLTLPMRDYCATDLSALSSKPLLILDLNQVLVCRVPYNKRGNQQTKDQLPPKRPFCDEFLEFCFANFAVAVWSCGKRANMEMWLFDKWCGELVFVWDQIHSTNLWPRRSVVAAAKPLFLKDLNKVYEAFPQWGPGSTMLVDNHAEKFERNLVGSCMLIPDFDVTHPDAANDSCLKQGGALQACMQGMCAPTFAGRIGDYCTDHPCNFFPTTHPAAPPPAPGDGEVGGQGGSGAQPWRAQADLTETAQRAVRNALVKLFYSSSVFPSDSEATRHAANPERYIREHPDTMGPKAMPLRRGDVGAVTGSEKPHLVSEKSDGTRHLLLALPKEYGREIGGAVYLVDRAWRVTVLRRRNGQAGVLCGDSGAGGAQCGATLLDGELIESVGVVDAEGEYSAGAGAQQSMYLCFDAAYIKGKDIGRSESLAWRLEQIQNDVIEPMRQAFAAPQSADQPSRLPILVKGMFDVSKTADVLSGITARGGHTLTKLYKHIDGRGKSWVTKNDGLVYTPSMRPYYKTFIVLKWKPAHELTIDFKLSHEEIDRYLFGLHQYKQSERSSKFPEHPEIALGVGGTRTTNVSKLALSPAQLQYFREEVLRFEKEHGRGGGDGRGGDSRGSGGKGKGRGDSRGDSSDSRFWIVECSYDVGRSLWLMHGVRKDKKKPNSIGTGWKCMEVAAEAFRADDLGKYAQHDNTLRRFRTTVSSYCCALDCIFSLLIASSRS
jgi:hypothetical protein